MSEPIFEDLGERVDLEADNDIDDMMDDVNCHVDGDKNHKNAEAKDGLAEANNHIENKHGQDMIDDANKTSPMSPGEDDVAVTMKEESKTEEKETNSMNDKETRKWAELLDLPPHDSEVFIGGFSRDSFEFDLRELCDPYGEIFEVRLLKDKENGQSKNCAFVTFMEAGSAERAVKGIHDKEFKGKKLRCSLSKAKFRLFISNIPKDLIDEDLKEILEETGPGVEYIDLVKDPQDPSRNRGFAFVDYYNHACADYSRQKMSGAKFKLDGSIPSVSWADAKNDTSASSQVKAVFVRNLPEHTTSEKLKELFQRHGKISKVVIPNARDGQRRDYGFVHYAERSSALRAVKSSEKYEIDGNVLEAVLSKQGEKKVDLDAGSNKPGLLSTPQYGYGADPYGAYGSGFLQPVMYGRESVSSGMRMVPTVLPDGRIGYVLEQPGFRRYTSPPYPRKNERNDNSSDRRNTDRRRNERENVSSDRRSRNDSRSRRHRPY